MVMDDAQPVLQSAQEPVAGVKCFSTVIRYQAQLTNSFQGCKSTCGVQFVMAAAMSQLQVLDDEFHIDHPAASGLYVVAAITFPGQFIFHSHPQAMNLLAPLFADTGRI